MQVANQSRAVFLKVRMLSGELSKRVTVEEVEAAVTSAVHELETELRKALQRAASMKLELETNEKLLKQLQKEWDAERTSLRGELANVKEQLTQLQQEQAADRTQFIEAVEKVRFFFQLLFIYLFIYYSSSFFFENAIIEIRSYCVHH
jgi:predicted  nucleic acid-binding Zn-ribbon protein